MVFGTTLHVHGMLQILHCLQALADLAVKEHRPWLTEVYTESRDEDAGQVIG